MNKKKIILIGGGGHCKSCIDVIEKEGTFEIAGILDLKEKIGEKILNYSIIGSDEDLELYVNQNYYFLITIGHIKSPKLRYDIYNKLKSLNAKMPIIISAKSTVSSYSKIGEGTIILHHCVVNANAEIGVNCIINTSSIIEHDVLVGNHCHISTGSIINGDSVIGDYSFLGSNTTVSNQIIVGEGVVVGAGSLILKNSDNYCTMVGVPAKKIK
jgi:sugar O-acyltransferase (sialic acid O-acetyltransferase NeuD family)